MTRCRGPLDRRTWLKLGGLSCGALFAGLEPTLARLLAAEAKTTPADKDFSVILFWANGGPSHLDMFDLKPDAPAEIRGPFRPIRTNVPGMEITELLPRLAKMADKFALVRSLHHERAEHSGGTHRFLTGYPSRAANLQDAEYPEIGSIVAARWRPAAERRARCSSPTPSSTAAARPTSARRTRRSCPAPTRSRPPATTSTTRSRSTRRRQRRPQPGDRPPTASSTLRRATRPAGRRSTGCRGPSTGRA